MIWLAVISHHEMRWRDLDSELFLICEYSGSRVAKCRKHAMGG